MCETVLEAPVSCDPIIRRLILTSLRTGLEIEFENKDQSPTQTTLRLLSRACPDIAPDVIHAKLCELVEVPAET